MKCPGAGRAGRLVLGSLVALLGTVGGSASAAGVGAPLPEPPFERYRVAPTFRGTPAAVDLRSDRRARRFRTVLRQGAAGGPDFADHFTVVTWGCGSGCQSHAIVDARTGAVVVLPGETSYGIAYRRDSRLLVLDPADRCIDPDVVGPVVSTWYAWNGRALVRLRSPRIVAPC